MQSKRLNIAVDRLRELLDYCPETGVFRWKVKRSRSAQAHSIAGTVNEQGYILITVDRSIHRAHRLAWVYIHGSAPCGDIDHINGIRSDNRICNLRDVSHTVNLQNRKGATVSSKSGILGVRKHRACDKWEARIKVAGKQRYLGLYETAEEAREAYLSAKRQFHAGNTL